MSNINRGQFLRIGALGTMAAMYSPNVWGQETSAFSNHPLYDRLLKSNDQSVTDFLKRILDGGPQYGRLRASPVEFAILSVSYCLSGSEYYQSDVVLQRMEEITGKLNELQYPDGTLDSGGNRQSPPDTAFLLEHLCPAAALLNQHKSGKTERLMKGLNGFLLKTGEALITGGVHTPNHRWVITAGLAGLYRLYNDDRYLRRIDEWLADGIYIDSDGQYPERSRNYSEVENRSLITIGHILNRPELFSIAEKNLISTYYFSEENGELITVDSRRQDQNFLLSITGFYLSYRFIAIRNNNPMLAAVTRKIESLPNFEQNILRRSMINFLDMPLLLQELPGTQELPSNYTQFFPLTHVARIKRGITTATIFGGNDRPIIIASGRSTNPSFFTFRKGEAILDYMRLSTSFFRMGYFRSEGLTREGNTYKLSEKKSGYYYQPMPAEKRDPAGDYELSQSLDGRYWSKMDFESRPLSNVLTLETDVTIHEENGEYRMEISVTGALQVEVTLEMCFRKGGEFTSAVKGDSDDDYFLDENYTNYEMGKDSISIGPGKLEHRNIRGLDGEMYSTHFGSIKGDGMHLFVTGYTPFNHTIYLK
jgi:hypothetical protein